MDIDCWESSPNALVARQNGNWRAGQLVGLICTLLLHALVVQTAILAGRAPKVRPPDSQGPGATLLKSAIEPVEALILVDLPSVDVNSRALREDIASAGAPSKTPLITLVSTDPLPHVEVPADRVDAKADTVAIVDSGDPAGRALLFGRYSGQLQARIERAWLRPRSPVMTGDSAPNEPNAAQADFRCQVRILQGTHGAVQEVQMLECNGSVTWQQSLVTGIFAASPLPAPPDPAVFSQALTMTFEGRSYTPGSSTEGYEVERVAPLAGKSR